MEEDRQGNKLIHQRKGLNKGSFPLLKIAQGTLPCAYLFAVLFLGKLNWGNLGKNFLKMSKKRQFFGKKRTKTVFF